MTSINELVERYKYLKNECPLADEERRACAVKIVEKYIKLNKEGKDEVS